jgi:long-chain acyl-CoA synthetase
VTPTAVGDTFPKLLAAHATVRGARPAIREKDLGIWQSWSWSEVLAEVRVLACGLAAQGLARGQHLALVGENRPRLYWTAIAAQCLGAIPVPLYQDAVAAEMLYVFQDAEIGIALAEDQEQVDKLLEILPQAPRLARIVFDQPRGLRHYTQPQLLAFEALQEEGRRWDAAHPGFFEREMAAGHGQETAALFYTSGTTGRAKGVVLTHDALIDRARAGSRLEGLTDREETLAYLPMAWIGQNIFSYAQWLVTGFTVNCPESPATVANDLREIGPTYYFAPPRVLEAMLTHVMIRMEDASFPKRKLFDASMALARRVGARILDGKPVPPLERLAYRLCDWLVYGPLRNVLGMSRVRVAYTAGEAIGPDLFVFYRSIGVNLKQLYGSTETCVFVCIQPDGQVKPDTVGPPVEGVQVAISAEGELLIKSPGLLKEYYKNPDATRDVKTPDGWYRTGDAGYLDADGHLKIIDRYKDVGKLADGSLFAPKFIENKLKFFPYIKEAVAFGNGRDWVGVFVNIDMEAVGNWAERRNLPYAGYVDLAQQDAVYELIAQCIDKVNADLAADERLARSQIRRFLVLHKELDPDDDELTRTRKVRRGFIAEKYAELLQALYAGRAVQHVETQVKFEDGRSGVVAADIRIRDVATAASTMPRRAA